MANLFIFLVCFALGSSAMALDSSCSIEIKKKALIHYLTNYDCSAESCMECGDVAVVSSTGKDFSTEVVCGLPSDWSDAVKYSIAAKNADVASTQDQDYCTIEDVKVLSRWGN